jgi:AAA ATPase domain
MTAMLADVPITVQRWPIVGRRPELEVFEQALSSEECAGLVIHGRAGVGKTRLADECRRQAVAAGHPTERVTGSRTTARLPLAAVAVLLAGGLGRADPDGRVDTAALFDQTRRALEERHGGRRVVTVADDVALLDTASLALLGYLAAQGTIFLIATVRTGEPVPDLVIGLWRDGQLARVDLADLSRANLDTLLHLALGGPIEAGAGRELWEVTKGNPLYVRELVLGALESGALVERSGVWHLDDPVPSTTRLADLVEQRIGHLGGEARSVLELLAPLRAPRDRVSRDGRHARRARIAGTGRPGDCRDPRRGGTPSPPAARQGTAGRDAKVARAGDSAGPGRSSGSREPWHRLGGAADRDLAAGRRGESGHGCPGPRCPPGPLCARLSGRAAPHRVGAWRAA